jgi:hypothetical protein
MKPTRLLSYLLAAGLITTTGLKAQNNSKDSTGMPGDHFSLEGALHLFKKAGNPEEFERLLNSEDNRVNNLDLNGDGDIDYIKVIGKKEKDAHVFILQVPVSETENQDIAVIEVEKTGDENAVLQIIGDEEIFGEQVIVEPGEAEEENIANDNENRKGPNADYSYESGNRIVVNVWFWPSVRFIYGPSYRVWISPWRWHYYPAWWRPWRPLGWRAFHPHCVRYRPGFAVVRTHRVVHAHRVYTPHRTTSVIVRNRHAVARSNYHVTRSRTTVVGPRGNSVTRKTTTVSGRNGRVKASKTTVRRKRH